MNEEKLASHMHYKQEIINGIFNLTDCIVEKDKVTLGRSINIHNGGLQKE